MTKTDYKSFEQCLKVGQEFEKKALNFFKYEKVFFPQGKHSEYDFILDDDIKIEVKSDCLSGQTGNLCIEFENRKKPSGIEKTTADFWIYFVRYSYTDKNDFDVYKIPTKKIKKRCKKYGRIVSGGDGGNSKMFLINKSKFKKYLIHQSQKRTDCMFS